MAFYVDVITTKRNDPNHVIDSRRINYDNSRSRDWLGRHSNWALRNGHAVHTAKAEPGTIMPRPGTPELIDLLNSDQPVTLKVDTSPPVHFGYSSVRGVNA